ncbi:hypothetical protein HK099_000432 [Clydaea vesicula]|uniref:Uncharacterized protein n=1 Tax=Clydaea vesicula TaxID=447962 RepID=A0AAD5XZE4_9FUNG|nr:hypothetical protein HK099_000432 [Clydaea vesicula]
MVAGKNRLEGIFPTIKPAPKSFYFKAVGVGVIVGALFELLMIKSNYYQVMKDSELRKIARNEKNQDQKPKINFFDDT